jgi:hypothetical protein
VSISRVLSRFRWLTLAASKLCSEEFASHIRQELHFKHLAVCGPLGTSMQHIDSMHAAVAAGAKSQSWVAVNVCPCRHY